jgi:L-alanine-DL-glutamate epimerase-like enolase superfamily enzyme
VNLQTKLRVARRFLPFKQGNPPAKAISSVAAVALARKYNVPIRYDFNFEQTVNLQTKLRVARRFHQNN